MNVEAVLVVKETLSRHKETAWLKTRSAAEFDWRLGIMGEDPFEHSHSLLYPATNKTPRCFCVFNNNIFSLSIAGMEEVEEANWEVKLPV